VTAKFRLTRGLSLVAGRSQLGPVGEGLIFEDTDSAHERGALLALARPELRALRPPRELAVRGELERLYLLSRQAPL
jgi:hypothetical protein